jgi:SAM-dependent methyltransferase
MSANFDGLARAYRWLETIAFGGALARARFAHIDRLAGCRNILLLGDGDGRFLARLSASGATIRSIDASAEMLRLAAARLSPEARSRVTFECADALAADLPPNTYDGVATLFFLDCFTEVETADLVAKISRALTPSATWLFADFAVPERGASRIAARAVTSALYMFFRWRTGIAARRLPDSENEIRRAGFAPAAASTFVSGLLRSVAFRRETRSF